MFEHEATGWPQFSGMFLGVVLDLSGSMRESMNNKGRHQFSRIENVSNAFRSAIEDVGLLTNELALNEQVHLRLFVNGFGFMPESAQSWQDYIGDVLSVAKNAANEIERYRPLQKELEELWNDEIASVLEEKRILVDAKAELRQFVEAELREQAINAEQQRSAAKFQRWCVSVCQGLEDFDGRLRRRIEQNRRFEFVLMPLMICILWVLKAPALLLNFLSQSFENWLQKKLLSLRNDADKFAAQQSEKVVYKTKEALTRNQFKISGVIEQGITNFIDAEAFKLIRLYNRKSSSQARLRAFDRDELKRVHEDIAKQITDIMSPHANAAWKASVALLKAAARALRITPDWECLKEKTIVCAHQVAWEKIAPEVQSRARRLAKERFVRAVLITIAQKTKDKKTTMTLEQIASLLTHSSEAHIAVDEFPIFGGSPMGLTLQQAFCRICEEAHLPQNKGLRPAIMIISDGLPTDSEYVDLHSLAEDIKNSGIPIVSCFVTNRNVLHPWLLPQQQGLFWPQAAKLMFTISSNVDEWPQFAEKLRNSRFVLRKRSGLFMQINHAEYLQNFVEAILLPIDKETQQLPI